MGSGIGQFNGPFVMSLDSSGTAYIADMYNDRIVVVDPATFTLSLLTLNLGGLLPYCVHYDRSRDRLYVGLYGGAQPVLIFGSEYYIGVAIERRNRPLFCMSGYSELSQFAVRSNNFTVYPHSKKAPNNLHIFVTRH